MLNNTYTNRFNKEGNNIYEEESPTTVYSEKAADTMVDMMTGVLTRGTAAKLGWYRNTDMIAACKTGTTNYDSYTMDRNNLPGDAIRDSWVVGYSTKTTMAVWYGYDYIDSYYCLHNLPATMAKDRLYNALVNSKETDKNNRKRRRNPSFCSPGVLDI